MIKTFIFLIFIVNSFTSYSQWEDISINNKESYKRVRLLNDSTVFVISQSALYRSTDFGENWDTLYVNKNENPYLIDFFFIDLDTGYLITNYNSSNHFLKTTDGGTTWIDLGDCQPGVMYFTDELNGFIASTSFSIFTTNNGGNSWERNSNTLDATMFELDGDKGDIVFTLEKRPDYNNKLTGVLIDENGAEIPHENVVAYLVETGSFGHHYLYKGTSTTTNGKGEFEIENLIPGSYVVYAYSRHMRELVPGYYKSDSDFLISRWQDGKRIEVEANGSFGNITMQMEILGPIVRNKTLSGKVGVMTSLSPGSEEPESGLRGVNVFVTDENGKVINYTHSENEGDFKVENLKTGELTVIYDKVGYKAEQQTVTFDKEDTEKYTTAEMTKLSPTKVDEYTEIEAVVYPNPASESLNISGEFTGSSYTIKLIDMAGRVQLYKKVNYTDKEVLELNVSELTSGNYLLLITGNGEKLSTQLKVIR